MLDTLIHLLLSPLGLTALLIALGVTLALMTVTSRKTAGRDPMDRLKSQARGAAEQNSGRRLLKHEKESELQKRLAKFKSMLEPASEAELSAARLEMIQAGYHGKNAVRDFHAAKFILGLSGLGLGLLFVFLNSGEEPPSTIMMIVPIMVPTLLGYYAPIYWVNKRKAERQEQIAQGFPDALDMLLICTEAGQSMDQSITRIARELRHGYPALAEEFETVSHEIKAGKDRLEVLRDMGERCGNADIRSFVTVLIQSATYGTSTADALRVYAAEMRDKRVMLAEEKANVLPTKLTLGTMMFTVPPLLIILIGPSVYGVTVFLNSAQIGM
jgi:tight adherence protein C